MVRQAGGNARVEPIHLDDNSRKRVDLDLLMDNARSLVDVSIVHPTAKSHLPQAVTGQLATAYKQARIKKVKYSEIAARNEAPFIPFIMETYGGIIQEGTKLTSDIASFYEQHSLVGTGEWRNLSQEVMEGVAIALQRGNGLAARSCLYAPYASA